MGLRFTTLEMDVVDDGESDDNAAVRFEHVSRAIHVSIQKGRISESPTDLDSLDHDVEMAYCSMAKAIVIPRARQVSTGSAIHSTIIDGDAGRQVITALRAARPGSLESLEWIVVPRTKCVTPATLELPATRSGPHPHPGCSSHF